MAVAVLGFFVAVDVVIVVAQQKSKLGAPSQRGARTQQAQQDVRPKRPGTQPEGCPKRHNSQEPTGRRETQPDKAEAPKEGAAT